MNTDNVVGQVYKPSPEQLVEMYETFDDGQSREIRCQFREGTLSTAQVQALIEHRNMFPEGGAKIVRPTGIKVVRKTLKPCAERTGEEQLAEWVSLYAEMGITLNPSEVLVPPRPSGFDRLILVAMGMTAQKVFEMCAARFPCWEYANDSLDIAVPVNDRTADKGAYAVWVRDRVEADEELEDLSTEMLAAQDIKGVTLLERLLYELKYFKETKKHLDIKNWTLCSGSRDSDGSVPCVYWDGLFGRLMVRWPGVSLRCSYLRSRAVSL